MNKKKITYEDWCFIGQCNYAAKWLRPICSYTLIKEPDGRFKREQRISWPIYILLFIPAHLLQAIMLIWDGGLKEFELEERYLGGDWMTSGSGAFIKAEKIWNDKS